jgi:DNA-binding Lrp family transcriptional regulator
MNPSLMNNKKYEENVRSLPRAVKMDETDRKLLQIMQDAFPLVSKPWLEIGGKLNLKEEEVLSRVKRLLNEGAIRKVGPTFDYRKIGIGASTLIAMKVPPKKIEEVARTINRLEEVTHNYQRNHEYNLWFTLTARDEKSLQSLIATIKKSTGIENILNLPTVRLFKLDVRFNFE